MYDTVIVGSGAAGCSAAIYATRYSLRTLMLGGSMPGGLITEATEVENYPGYLSIGGQELAQKFIDQAVKLGAEYKVEIAEEVGVNDSTTGDNSTFIIRTSVGEYSSRSVILTTGTHHRKLGIPGEDKFSGRGVSYCATCDAPFFKDKVVAVVGGGNSAVEGVQDIAAHAERVYLVYRSELRASPLYVEQMRKNKKIIEIPKTNILKIQGDAKVDSVVFDREFEKSKVLKLDGVFIQIGYAPNTKLAKQLGLTLSEYGYVNVDAGMGTNKKGIFCAGDVNNSSNQLHQQITSAAEGAIAAQSVYRYLKGHDYLIMS